MSRQPLSIAIRSILLANAAFTAAVAHAEEAAPARRNVDLVLALDVSSSMDGLIESAKQRLADVTNELARAQPLPNLRVALITYGSPAYGEQSGYVRIDLPFTSDLDAVYEVLFAFRTGGGDEYVSRVIQTSLDSLQWSAGTDALRMLVVAGNESAEQDPRISVAEAGAAAAARGVVVNTIYCGTDGDDIARGWQRVANATNGLYAYIDQNAAAVAAVATPVDARLAALNSELNATYVPFGALGSLKQERQAAQDGNAAAMSPQAAASRAVSKAGALYRTDWDLVDAVAEGAALEDIAVEELPPAMQEMTAAQRTDYVRAKTAQRAAIEGEIAELDAQRREHLAAAARERAQDEQESGLDAALIEGIREVAESKGFAFPAN